MPRFMTPAFGIAVPLVGIMLACELHACQGDLNDDGQRNLSDLAVLLAHYGAAGGAAYELGDLDGDGDVDLADLAALLSVYGTPCPDVGDMIFIPAGPFQMGDTFGEGHSDEAPVHAVYVSPYYIDPHETTNQEYVDALNWAFGQGEMIAVVDGVVFKYGGVPGYPYCDTSVASSFSQITWNGATFGVVAGRESHPVVRVTWYGAAAYSNWRGVMEGWPTCYDLASWTCNFDAAGYRLPSEAQWEKAARGGTAGHRFPWSDQETIQHARANYYSSPSYEYDTSPTRGYHPTFSAGASPFTAPVGYFAPNDYGIHEMAGNVWEWCHDWYAGAYYAVSPSNDPTGPATGAFRVQRGGGWDTHAYVCRCADRFFNTANYRSNYGGFRLVLIQP